MTASSSGSDAGEDWAAFLKRNLNELGWDNLDLAKEIGIDRSQVSRWLRRESFPKEESIRSVCHALQVDIRYGIVAAGQYTAEEMKLGARPSTREVLRTCAPEELTEELLDRVRRGNPTTAGVGGPFEEQHKAVVGPIKFQDGRRNGRPA